MNKKLYFLAQDDDCHWYVVPVDMETDFDAWVERADPYEATPEYIEAIGGSPRLVRFTKYTIN